MKTFLTSFMIAMVLVPNLYATSLGTNLVINGDAEAGVVNQLPFGWEASGPHAADFITADAYFGENVQTVHHKVLEIYNSLPNREATLSQTIDVSAIQSQIATGLVALSFSGQAFSWYGATARYTIEELDVSDNLLNTHTSGYISLLGQSVNYHTTDSSNCTWTTTSVEAPSLNASTAKLRISVYGKTSNNFEDYVDFDNIQLILYTLPTVTTTSVTTYGKNSATMGGNVTADNGSMVTNRGVVYSSTDATPTIGEAGVTQDVNGAGAGSFSELIGSLSAGTTYYIRAYATNAAGTAYGSVVSFTTLNPPSISSVTAPADGTYSIGQNLDYTVNFNEAVNVVTTGGTPYLTLTVGSSTVHAAYYTGTATSTLTFRYTVASDDYDVDGIALSSNITLNGGTIKDAANNDATLSFAGSTATNVQIALSPTVTTDAANSLTSSGATMNGTVNANNAATSVTFEYGLTAAYGSSVTALESPVNGTSAVAVSYVLGGLAANTTYHYRVVATNSGGTTYGDDVTFATSEVTGMDYATNEELVLYPNPMQDGFYVNAGETACELTICTLSGQVVYRQSVCKGSFVAMASFASGVYLVKLNDKIQKLIKN